MEIRFSSQVYRPIVVHSDDSLSEGELVREMNWRESMLKYLISKNFEMCMSKVPTPSSMMSYPQATLARSTTVVNAVVTMKVWDTSNDL